MNQTRVRDHTINLKHYLGVVWRRKGLIALASVMALCGALATLEFIPDIYVSRVTILIADRQPLSSELEQIMGGMTRPSTYQQGMDERRLAHMVGRIRSRPFLERVIRLLEMDRDSTVVLQARERQSEYPGVTVDELVIRSLVQNLQSRLTFSSTGAGVFQIGVADYSSRNAQTLANWISELFVDTSIQNSLEYLRATHDFGAEQLRIYEERLHVSERALAQYREAAIQRSLNRNLVVAENVALAEVLQQRIEDEVIAGRIRLRPLREAILATSSPGDEDRHRNDGTVREREERLKSALRDEVVSRLATGTSSDWPPSGNYDVRRKELFDVLEARTAVLYPSLPQEARTRLARHMFAVIVTDAQSDAAELLRSAIGDFRRRAQSLPDDEAEVARLTADVEENRQLLDSFRAQLVASDVSQAMETTKLGMQIEILDPAQLPLEPSRPNRRKAILAALLIGPFIGLGLGLIGETMDTTLRSLEDFRDAFPEPLLGMAPLLGRRTPRSGRFRRYWVPASVSAVVLLTLLFFVAGDGLVARVTRDSKPVEMSVPEDTP